MNQSESTIERLIKLAGERDVPSPEGMERARLAAHESWSRMLGQRGSASTMRSRVRTMLGFALAAGIAAIAVFAWTERHRATARTPRGTRHAPGSAEIRWLWANGPSGEQFQ